MGTGRVRPELESSPTQGRRVPVAQTIGSSVLEQSKEQGPSWGSGPVGLVRSLQGTVYPPQLGFKKSSGVSLTACAVGRE